MTSLGCRFFICQIRMMLTARPAWHCVSWCPKVARNTCPHWSSLTDPVQSLHTVGRPHTDPPCPNHGPHQLPGCLRSRTCLCFCAPWATQKGLASNPPVSGLGPLLCSYFLKLGSSLAWPLPSPPPLSGQKTGFMDTLPQSWLSQLLMTKTPQGTAPPRPPCLPHLSSQGSCSYSSARGRQLAPPGRWSPPGHTGTDFLLGPSSPPWELKTASSSSIIAPGVSTGHTHALHHVL